MFLTENIAGAFTSYQSFFVKGSTLEAQQGREDEGWERVKAIYHPTVTEFPNLYARGMVLASTSIYLNPLERNYKAHF